MLLNLAAQLHSMTKPKKKITLGYSVASAVSSSVNDKDVESYISRPFLSNSDKKTSLSIPGFNIVANLVYNCQTRQSTTNNNDRLEACPLLLPLLPFSFTVDDN